MFPIIPRDIFQILLWSFSSYRLNPDDKKLRKWRVGLARRIYAAEDRIQDFRVWKGEAELFISDAT